MGLTTSLRMRVTGAFLALSASISILSAAGMYFSLYDMKLAQ